MVLVKILQPCGISVPPSVSLNLGMSGEMDPGPLLVLRTVWDVAIFGLERVERGFRPQPLFSLILPYHRLRVISKDGSGT